VLVVDARGRIAWQSPQAQRWLADGFAGADGGVAQAAAAWLAGVGAPGGADALGRRASAGGRQLVARRLGEVGLGETMWLLSLQAPGEPGPSRLATAALTPRETEVLSWVAKGKTNRDVADILGMSPRTVNKHLEHVFEKLGVETRAAAAALASRELG
jgi:DNA-binding CsgD family transcriptional regulator